MVITRKYDGHATQPFEDVVVFNDDVNADNLSCSGTFNFKVTDHTWMEGGGEFFITCSLGTYLSNTVIVIV